MNSIEISTTTATKFTVAFDGNNWTAFPDGSEIPSNWTVWQTGLTWEEAHDAIAETPALPVSVAASYDLLDALNDEGCASPGDYTTISMPGGYGDCLILHSRKAFGIWDALPKTHPDKCAVGYGAGSGMYIRD